jgi:N-acyl-D-amino-acid deacylase
MDFDRLFVNCRIVDGTGAPWYRGHIGLNGGTIAHVGRGTAASHGASTVVDLGGDVLAPGFIDTHTHSDLQLFEDPLLAPKTKQGVTTEILGQDGFSVAPAQRDPGGWAERVSALDGRTNAWEWGGVDDYLNAIKTTETAQNFGTLVGHGTVRFEVMGMDEREPTEDELSEMQDLVAESLAAGALGLSTGLIYQPQSNATTAELRALCDPLSDVGRPFVAHIRSEGRWLWEALDEFADVGESTEVPLHLSHYKLSGTAQQGKAGRANAFIESARERGVDMTAEVYPYTAGHTSLSTVLPPWVRSGEPDEIRETLEDHKARTRIKKDIVKWRIPGWENVGALAGWENLSVTNLTSEEFGDEDGRSLAAIAADRAVHPIEALCDILLAENLDAAVVVHSMDEEDVAAIIGNERVNVASDGIFGEHPHPRLHGTFPRVLGTYVREDNELTLEAAVRKMTSLPARVMGLQDKGLVREGMDADLVVFEDRHISSRASFAHPTREPTGIEAVYVAGEPVVQNGELTGETPGDVYRS